VHFNQVFLLEFTYTCWLGELELVVLDDHGKSAYDIILGHDLLEHAGLDVIFIFHIALESLSYHSPQEQILVKCSANICLAKDN
jgi:hypothetical protein